MLNLASGDDGIRQRSLELVFRALALTARLGAPFYSVHAGFITDPTSFGKTSFVFPMPASPDDTQFALHRFTTALEMAVDRAQHLGVQLLVENNVCSRELSGKLLLLTADELLECIEQHHRRVGDDGPPEDGAGTPSRLLAIERQQVYDDMRRRVHARRVSSPP